MFYHYFTAYNETSDILCEVVMPSKFERHYGPDRDVRALTFKPAELMPKGGAAINNLLPNFSWRATWDHEPSELEKDEHRPDGHRSTDDDDDMIEHDEL